MTFALLSLNQSCQENHFKIGKGYIRSTKKILKDDKLEKLQIKNNGILRNGSMIK